MVKLEIYHKNENIKKRHTALEKEIATHGIGEVVYTLRQMYMEAYTHRQVLKNDRKWVIENYSKSGD